MKKIFIKVYRKIIPEKVRKRISEIVYNFGVHYQLFVFWRKIIIDYFRGGVLKAYKSEVMFVLKHGIKMFPYEFIKKYSKFECDVFWDDCEQKYYVLHKGKKLYFPKGANPEGIKNTYRQLIVEQDKESPHCYWSDINMPQRGDVFLDVGSAEGMIALEWIDVVDKAVLIECEEEWQDALRATFEPYKEKVCIIKKLCCDRVGENRTTIDSVIGDFDSLVIKMDIEGAEVNALEGAKKTLERKNVKLAVCTYHNSDDAKKIEKIAQKYEMLYEFSKGSLLLPYDTEIQYPYFRKGVLRGMRKQPKQGRD